MSHASPQASSQAQITWAQDNFIVTWARLALDKYKYKYKYKFILYNLKQMHAFVTNIGSMYTLLNEK